MSKKYKFLIVGVITLAILVLGTTFASWYINSKQTNYNVITSGCVDVTFSDESGTITMDDTYPMEDVDALQQDGYTFTIRNNCRTKVGYTINLDLFNVANSTNLTADEIKVAVDNYAPRRVSMLDNVAVNDSDAYAAKTLVSGTLTSKASETKTVKMWVDVNSTTQDAVFSNKIFVKAGPNLNTPEVAPDNCFIAYYLNSSPKGFQIMMYLTSASRCPDNVIVPMRIGNVTSNLVRKFASFAFEDANVITNYDGSMLYFIILDDEHYDTLSNIITTLVDHDIEENGGIGDTSITDYEIYSLEEYENNIDTLDNLDLYYVNGDGIDPNVEPLIDDAAHRLNIPLDLDISNYLMNYGGFYQSHFEAIPCEYYDSSGELIELVGWNKCTNPIPGENYLKSIDFTRTKVDDYGDNMCMGNKGLERIELPNDRNVFVGRGAFNGNAINKLFWPTFGYEISAYSFANNNLTTMELYDGNASLEIEDGAFWYNNISSLVVNQEVAIYNMYTSEKPFDHNPLTAADIHINSTYSTNTPGDFITITP